MYNKSKAVRYGTLIGEYTDSAIPQIVSFVLGTEVANSVSVANERMLDVVIPLKDQWDLDRGKAPIVVFIPGSGESLRMNLGDILVRSKGTVDVWDVVPSINFEHAVTVNEEQTLAQDLSSVMNRHCVDSATNLPDFLLADHLLGSLETLKKSLKSRDVWFRRS